ncbi:hypothetical protein INR49_030324 [Caranx melampygus]|nr:hypothetical protein INR49_030324 [Caranx melampygus]
MQQSSRLYMWRYSTEECRDRMGRALWEGVSWLLWFGCLQNEGPSCACVGIKVYMHDAGPVCIVAQGPVISWESCGHEEIEASVEACR